MSSERCPRDIGVAKRDDLDAIYKLIAEELRSQYTVGYYSSNPARDGSYRKIKVEVARKNSDALARRGYYAAK